MNKKKEMNVTIVNEASDKALNGAYQMIYKTYLKHLKDQKKKK